MGLQAGDSLAAFGNRKRSQQKLSSLSPGTSEPSRCWQTGRNSNLINGMMDKGGDIEINLVWLSFIL